MRNTRLPVSLNETTCTTVETVGEVDRVTRADNDERPEHDKEPAEIQGDLLEKRDHQRSRERVASESDQRVAGGERDHRFDRKPDAAGETIMVLLCDFQIIVVKTDEAETEGHCEHNPHIWIEWIGP